MNVRSLTLKELVRAGCGDELIRRLRCGEAYLARNEDEAIQDAFDDGAESEALTKRESIVGDIVDLLNGEVWQEGMTDDQRYFLIEDLDNYVAGSCDGSM